MEVIYHWDPGFELDSSNGFSWFPHCPVCTPLHTICDIYIYISFFFFLFEMSMCACSRLCVRACVGMYSCIQYFFFQYYIYKGVSPANDYTWHDQVYCHKLILCNIQKWKLSIVCVLITKIIFNHFFLIWMINISNVYEVSRVFYNIVVYNNI